MFIVEMQDRSKYVLVGFHDDENLGDVVKVMRQSPTVQVLNTTTSAVVGSPTEVYGENYSRWLNWKYVVSIYRDDAVKAD